MQDHRQKDLWITDTEVEDEIATLSNSDYVRLARAEQRMKYRRRQYLYQLRTLEKRGRELAEIGWVPGPDDLED